MPPQVNARTSNKLLKKILSEMEVAMLYKTLVLNKAKDLYRWTDYTPSTATKTGAHVL